LQRSGTNPPGDAGATRTSTPAPAADLVITGATLIDGIGAAPRDGVSIVVRDGRIAAVKSADDTVVPKGSHAIDASGKDVIPGLGG
jgi:imidazolonepropionase-like amidohydrolase